MITVKVNVSQVDKARLFKGAKGTYLDLILIETPNGEYGDFMVKQQVTKEEREAKLQMPILGNAKWLGQKSAQGQSDNQGRYSAQSNAAPRPTPQENLDDDSIPF